MMKRKLLPAGALMLILVLCLHVTALAGTPARPCPMLACLDTQTGEFIIPHSALDHSVVCNKCYYLVEFEPHYGGQATCAQLAVCTGCHAQYGSLANHDSAALVTDTAVAPTCTEAGLTEGSHCSVCSTVTDAQELIPATGHTEVMDQAVPPTCTATGLTVGCHCSVCGTVIDTPQVVEAADHKEVINNAVAPTCTESGLTEGSHCSVCKTVLAERKTAPALGHDYVVVKSLSNTCLHGGYSLMRCARCGDETKANIKERLSHLYGPWSPAGDGTHTAECVKGCGYIASTPCEPKTITMDGQPLSACPVCGAVSGERDSLPEGMVMAAVDGAGAKTARGELPGELIARFADGPLYEGSGVLRLYTLAWEFAGTGTPTGPLSVSLLLQGELPAFRLVCVSGPDAGKDIPFEVRDGALVFTASLPGAFALMAE